jgi:hypothetical protein
MAIHRTGLRAMCQNDYKRSQNETPCTGWKVLVRTAAAILEFEI